MLLPERLTSNDSDVIIDRTNGTCTVGTVAIAVDVPQLTITIWAESCNIMVGIVR